MYAGIEDFHSVKNLISPRAHNCARGFQRVKLAGQPRGGRFDRSVQCGNELTYIYS